VKDDDKSKLQRRTFLAMLGATVATVALRDKVRLPDDPPRSAWRGKTRWIGHC
jgi:hypothetical protein